MVHVSTFHNIENHAYMYNNYNNYDVFTVPASNLWTFQPWSPPWYLLPPPLWEYIEASMATSSSSVHQFSSCCLGRWFDPTSHKWLHHSWAQCRRSLWSRWFFEAQVLHPIIRRESSSSACSFWSERLKFLYEKCSCKRDTYCTMQSLSIYTF